jgi:dCTP deaminase
LRLTVDLQGNGSGVVGYQAKKFTPPIDLSKIDFYETSEFWTPLYRNDKLQYILSPGDFYILASKQRVRVQPEFAAELLPYDLASQEFRVHYAGFFDPGFGYGVRGEVPGTRAVLEVRASQMPILLEDDQFVGRLNYYGMSAPPDRVYGGRIGSSYQQQGLALSKQFRRERQYLSGASLGDIIKAGASSETESRQRVSKPQAAEQDDDIGESRRSFNFLEAGAEQMIGTKGRES